MTKPHINRRRAIATLGAAGLGGVLVACRDDSSTSDESTAADREPTGAPANSDLVARLDEANSCSVTPEQTAGPYYLNIDEMRSDIREDRDGTALDLAVRVRDPGCEPVPGVMVEVWHCDTQGIYSGFATASNDARGVRAAQTDGATYLRGTQTTDEDGIVRFVTIYPGWYPGRAVHVHVKVHLVGSEVLTTQLYFDDDMTATIHQAQPAYGSEGSPDTTNAQDAFFAAENLLTVSEESDGYLGLINVGIRD